MSQLAGRAILYGEGKRILRNDGTAILGVDGRCSECCTPYILNSRTIDPFGTWSMAGRMGDGVATPCSFWQIVPVGTCNVFRWANWNPRGCVNSMGKLGGLQTPFTNPFDSEVRFNIQIGCRSASVFNQINWPNSCQSSTTGYVCS